MIRRAAPRSKDAAVTLVEVLVSLVIFSIIGVAGYAMLDLVARTERLTEGRLQSLGQMQRAMYLINLDFHLAEDRSLLTDGSSVSLRRAAPDATGGEVTLSYALTGAGLSRRMMDAKGNVLAEQSLLPGVVAVDWQFLAAGPDWSATWPPPGQAALVGMLPVNPRAVTLTLTLADGKALRRVAVLPAPVR